MIVKKTVASIAFGLVTSLAWQAAANSPTFLGDPFSTLTTAQLNQFDAGKDQFSQEEDCRRWAGSGI